MHLKQAEIQNFRGISSRQVSFTDRMGAIRPVSVIAGPNGSGKTSILYAIVQALRGVMGYRNADVPEASDDDIYRSTPSGQRITVATAKLHLHFDQDEMDAIDRVFEVTDPIREHEGGARLSPPRLLNGNLSVTWRYPPDLRQDGSKYPVSWLWCDSPGAFGPVWLKGATYAWRGFKQRLTGQDDLNKIGMLRFFSQSRDPRLGVGEDVQDPGANGPSSEMPTNQGDDRGGPRLITVIESLRRLGEFAHGQGLAAGDERKRWEQHLQERFSRICAPKRYLGYWYDHSRYGETPLLEENGREYPFRAAASGEQVILQYLTQFAFPRPVNNSLILIDEPELHLHPSWVRKLYRALPQMGRNNQFIMTTHSAELRQMAAEDNAIEDLGKLDEQPGEVAGHAK